MTREGSSSCLNTREEAVADQSERAAVAELEAGGVVNT